MLTAKEAKELTDAGIKRQRDKQSARISEDMQSWRNKVNENRPAFAAKVEAKIRSVADAGGKRCIFSCDNDDDVMTSLLCEMCNELNDKKFVAELDRYVSDSDDPDYKTRDILYVRWG